MPRYSHKDYRLQVLALMAVYVAVLLLVWPHARDATNSMAKSALALAPIVPVIIVLGLMVKRIIRSDELEQRVHLIALSVATCIVSALSLVGGFLSASHVVSFDGDILIWVFPVLCLIYGVTRWYVGRRYGGVGCG